MRRGNRMMNVMSECCLSFQGAAQSTIMAMSAMLPKNMMSE
jgi:hypothetical protein